MPLHFSGPLRSHGRAGFNDSHVAGRTLNLTQGHPGSLWVLDPRHGLSGSGQGAQTGRARRRVEGRLGCRLSFPQDAKGVVHGSNVREAAAGLQPAYAAS